MCWTDLFWSWTDGFFVMTWWVYWADGFCVELTVFDIELTNVLNWHFFLNWRVCWTDVFFALNWRICVEQTLFCVEMTNIAGWKGVTFLCRTDVLNWRCVELRGTLDYQIFFCNINFDWVLTALWNGRTSFVTLWASLIWALSSGQRWPFKISKTGTT